MPFIVPQPVNPDGASYCFHDKLFSPQECDKIITDFRSLSPEEAKIGANSKDTVIGKIDETKRKSDIRWFDWDAGSDWIFQRLAGAVFLSNQKFWKFNLSGFGEPIQLTHYKSSNQGFYDWHSDHGFGTRFEQRKISGIVLLADKFSGGKFELVEKGQVDELTLGSLVLFPSFLQHRVVPVTQGERWSLVFWISGPPFA